jgi:hemerythrin
MIGTTASLANFQLKAERLKQRLITASSSRHVNLSTIADEIEQQLNYEEQLMQEFGLALTSIHIDEHKKILEAISVLEFSWNAKRINDDVYVKALKYKLEFHHHYFDRPQLLTLAEEAAIRLITV